MTRSLPRVPRWAFTLIEMLVVIALMLILLTIAAAMFPRFAENHRIVKGADQVQGWLLNAKQRALRDRRPMGLRFVITNDPVQGRIVNEILYVEQKEDYTAGRYQGMSPPIFQPKAGYICNFPGTDFVGPGGSENVPEDWTVQAGDYVEFFGGGLVHEVWWVLDRNRLYLHPKSSPPPPTTTTNYRIIRQPRPVVGEAPLQLPQNIVVDVGLSLGVPVRPVYYAGQQGSPLNFPDPDQYPDVTLYPRYQNAANKFSEILFAPGGGVVGRGTSSGENIILWVRDITKTAPLEGSPFLVSIHTRTGLISVHPIDPTSGTQFPPGDPRCTWYNFTKDGRSSGL